MNKQDFLAQLRKGLSGLPQDDIEERLTFYSEMIDDRTEEGLSEEQAVAAVGNVDEIIAQIVAETSPKKTAKEKIKSQRQLKTGEIVLLVLGSPIWVSLLVAAIAVILSLYAALWSVIISLWAVFASFVGAALGGILGGAVFSLSGNALAGAAMIGAGLVCAGFSVFLFFGCRAATAGTVLLTKRIALGIKRWFVGREEA